MGEVGPEKHAPESADEGRDRDDRGRGGGSNGGGPGPSWRGGSKEGSCIPPSMPIVGEKTDKAGED